MKNKKLLSIIFILMLVVSLFPNSVSANTIVKFQLYEADLLLDTSNPQIGIAFFAKETLQTYSYSSTQRTGSGYFYKKSNGNKLASFNCTGYFSYDGTICNITDIDTSVWETADGWKVTVDEKKNQVSPTYACATGVFKLYSVGSSGESLSSSATINVYCNQKGSTSVEFNGDN